ncbi:MAG: hypothetical protein QF903_15535 [Planctomycetota bacterium]|nr:hypothetical protein [Planctomycetota bacterium]MDP6990881.1 hypothetical protein [Planctomycetota bacterium]
MDPTDERGDPAQRPRAGGRPMNLLRLAALQAVVDEALVEGLALADRGGATAWQDALRARVRERLPELLREQGRMVRGMARSEVLAELGSELSAVRAERDRLAGELEEVSAKLSHLRRTGAIQARAIARELESSGRERAEGMRDKVRALFADAEGEGASASTQRAGLEELVVEAWHDGRRWVEEVVDEESDRRIELFDRRIAKLSAQLAEREAALARAEAADPGLRSGYRNLRGLSGDDGASSLKRKLLEGVLEQNLILKSS